MSVMYSSCSSTALIQQHFGPLSRRIFNFLLLLLYVVCPALCYCTLKISSGLVIGMYWGVSLHFNKHGADFQGVSTSGWLHTSRWDQTTLYQLRIWSCVFKNRLMKKGPIYVLRGFVTYFCRSSPCSGRLCWAFAS